MYKIKLNKISIDQFQEFKKNNDFSSLATMNLEPRKNIGYPNKLNTIRCRSYDSDLHDAVITILSGVGLNLVSSFIYDLSVWIYHKYKENRIKKPMINGVEIDIENITPEEILSIITKNKDVNEGEDSSP
ncbi:hypothetical protein [Acinetobacter pollinis]|uniref:hypothetical protein n=1 Tax=Acinetobacter pollinis TaxID=2605270 RepID=UPI001D182A70|nr:hypothetical protein [Acinetobacter pollinis]